MFKKVLICAVLTTALMIGGCGEEKIIGTPEKAILAYAETVMTGTSENLSEAGFVADNQKEIRHAMTKKFISSMENIVPLNDDSAEQLTKIYFDKLKGNVTFKATLKKDDANNPIVELTATPIDQVASAKSAGKNDEFIALIGMIGKLKSEGATDDQIKENSDVQKLAVAAIGKTIDALSFQPEQTFEVPCHKIKGSDGNTHWAPADGDALINFLTGQS